VNHQIEKYKKMIEDISNSSPTNGFINDREKEDMNKELASFVSSLEGNELINENNINISFDKE
jgi:hypothetical protein